MPNNGSLRNFVAGLQGLPQHNSRHQQHHHDTHNTTDKTSWNEDEQETIAMDHNRLILIRHGNQGSTAITAKSQPTETTIHPPTDPNFLLQQLFHIHQEQIQHILPADDADDTPEDNHHDTTPSLTFDLMLNSNPQFTLSTELSNKVFYYHSKLMHHSKTLQKISTIVHFKIVTHNLALMLLSSGTPMASLHLLVTIFLKYIQPSTTIPIPASTTAASSDTPNAFLRDYHEFVNCRIIFLIMDCILDKYKADPKGLPTPLFSSVLAHADFHHINAPNTPTTTNNNNNNNNNKDDDDDDDDDEDKDNNIDNKIMTSIESLTVDDFFHWIESHVDRYSNSNNDTSSPADSQNQQDQSNSHKESDEYTNEIKFRLHLYKARILFLSSQSSSSQKNQKQKQDVTMRLSKKEMKSAMEIFQHKLRFGSNGSAGGDPTNDSMTGSIGSASDGPSTDATTTNDDAFYSQGTLKLEKQNQSALYLKANLEYLKQNYKKSLVLCNEARLAGDRHREQISSIQALEEHPIPNTTKQEEDLDTAIHFSNLGNVLQSTGRLHMAMLYYQKALNLVNKLSSTSYSNDKNSKKNKKNSSPKNSPLAKFCLTQDGMVRTIPAHDILHNTAICALQLQNWKTAYECMGKCVRFSPNIFAKRPRCWLRIAECCIGMHENEKKNKKYQFDVKIMSSTIGFPSRLLVDLNQQQPLPTGTVINLDPEIGSPNDLNQIESMLLPRALACLRIAITLCNNTHAPDFDCLEATRLSLAYVMLELNEPIECLEMARLVYNNNANDVEGTHENENDDNNVLRKALSDRRKATAKLYACEAFCKIGNSKKAFETIFGTCEEEELEKELEKESLNSLMTLKQLAYELTCTLPSDEEMHIIETCFNTSEEKEDLETLSLMMKRPTLNQAISSLRVSLSGLHASLDNVEAAERNAKLAMKNLEALGGSSVDIEPTARSVKKALLYCYLFKGDTDNTIQLLHSLI